MCTHNLHVVMEFFPTTVLRTIWMNIDGNRDTSISVPYSGQRASISLSNPSRPATSSNNLLAYRPRFSGLGALFLNIEAIFPCINSSSHFPVCGRLTFEEDRFFSRRPFIEAADRGNSFRIFSTTENIKTYGIAVEGCPELNAACWPNHAGISVFCLLPRDLCG